MKTLEEVIEAVWMRYNKSMADGKMRQSPGRAEYQIALQEAGLMEKTDDAAREFLWNYHVNTDIGKRIMKIERRMKPKLSGHRRPTRTKEQ